MSARIRGCSGHERIPLESGWEMAPGRSGDSSSDSVPNEHWLSAPVPGTVAGALSAARVWSVNGPSRDFDAEVWWFRTTFESRRAEPGERLVLQFDGLATLAEVWLNGRRLFESNNMFSSHEIDVSLLIEASNQLLIRFDPVQTSLAKRRPRPRWRVPMVAHQQLRWIRTTLLGRTPGWSPPAAPVGPWRPIWLERRRHVELSNLRIKNSVLASVGHVQLACGLTTSEGSRLRSAVLRLSRGALHVEESLALDASSQTLSGTLTIPDVELWWPHTHGDPALYDARIDALVVTSAGQELTIEFELGLLGFRTVSLDRRDGDFALYVNGTQVFCRGAVWTPMDSISLQARPEDYAKAVEQARSAGMNMLRVAGPFVYETDDFVRTCDRAGMLLWQDFMFANMDYPADDPDFAAAIRDEVTHELERLQAHPSLTVLCGNSEGAQQAAMSGAAREYWSPVVFETTLAGYAADVCPDVPYCPSSTHGGAFPFAANQGVTSYYGVGAYLRAPSDARRAELKFASECLAFANVPETQTLDGGSQRALRINQPFWKERVPRDLGAGWDFDDVRDYYLETLFRLPVAPLRYSNPERYLQFSRVASAEAMAAAFSEWRRAGSSCRGALILFFRDLWRGAGWGIIDSTGLPKAPYYYLRRVLAKLALLITDEGSNGLALHICNDTGQSVTGQLQLELFRSSQPVGRALARSVTIGPASTVAMNALDGFDGFFDLSYAYRFGPAGYDVMRVSLAGDGIPEHVEAFHFPMGLPNGWEDVGLSAIARQLPDGYEVTVTCRGFAQSVHFEVPGYEAADQYFHLAPRACRTVKFTPRTADAGSFEGTISALNARDSRRIELSS
jgi:beta-mannosidase